MSTSNIGRARTSRATTNGAARAHLREAAASTRDGVRDMGSAAKDVARSEFEALGERATSMRDEMLEKVAEKPLKSLLIAAGAGVLVGLLLRRR